MSSRSALQCPLYITQEWQIQIIMTLPNILCWAPGVSIPVVSNPPFRATNITQDPTNNRFTGGYNDTTYNKYQIIKSLEEGSTCTPRFVINPPGVQTAAVSPQVVSTER